MIITIRPEQKSVFPEVLTLLINSEASRQAFPLFSIVLIQINCTKSDQLHKIRSRLALMFFKELRSYIEKRNNLCCNGNIEINFCRNYNFFMSFFDNFCNLLRV